MTGALAQPLLSALPSLAVEARPEASILELPRSDQTIQAERERIMSELARELHDQLAQPLTGLLVQTEVFMREQQGHREVLDQLAFVKTSVREVLNDMRQILCDLRGEPGLANGLVLALGERLLATCQVRTGMKVSLWVSWGCVSGLHSREGCSPFGAGPWPEPRSWSVFRGRRCGGHRSTYCPRPDR